MYNRYEPKGICCAVVYVYVYIVLRQTRAHFAYQHMQSRGKKFGQETFETFSCSGKTGP